VEIKSRFMDTPSSCKRVANLVFPYPGIAGTKK
jgi:hypothetical protein